MKEVDWKSVLPVKGVELAAVPAGVKYENRNDLVLMKVAEHSTVAGVFTQNAFTAAPVTVCREHLNRAPSRYFVINSGNANACTGEEGYQAALQVCRKVADLAHVQTEQVLPFSTGVIGELLPAEKICSALDRAYQQLKENNWREAAEAIMTTDTRPKVVTKTVTYAGQPIVITGMSKGAGMIKPNMGTMLAYIATDAAIELSVLDCISRRAANKSFNRITIDGDTSTNDSCMLVATAQAPVELLTDTSGAHFDILCEAITEVYEQLAKAIVYDGEGATKFVEVNVRGGATAQESLDVAYAIAHSPLVKTALFASDPNWGRIVAAIGYAGIPELDATKIKVWLDDVLIVDNGGRAASYSEENGQTIFDKPEFAIYVDLGRGECAEAIWTSDLSHEYVRINAEYRS